MVWQLIPSEPYISKIGIRFWLKTSERGKTSCTDSISWTLAIIQSWCNNSCVPFFKMTIWIFWSQKLIKNGVRLISLDGKPGRHSTSYSTCTSQEHSTLKTAGLTFSTSIISLTWVSAFSSLLATCMDYPRGLTLTSWSQRVIQIPTVFWTRTDSRTTRMMTRQASTPAYLL